MCLRCVILSAALTAVFVSSSGVEDVTPHSSFRITSVPAGALHTRSYFDAATDVATSFGSLPDQADLVYSNSPQPDVYLELGISNVRVADDLTTIAVGGCSIKAYEFRVSGGGDGTGPGFGVSFGLYDGCPTGGGMLLPGAGGSLTTEHDGVTAVLVDLSANPIPAGSTVWLGVSVGSSGAGWLLGTPADIGFTRNVFDISYTPCSASFGGTPLHAGFDARVYCEPPFDREFLAYANVDPLNAHGSLDANEWMIDDVELIVDDCVLSSYEIGVTGTGGQTVNVTAQLRRACPPDSVIDGTQATSQFVADESPRLVRLDIPGGVDLGGGRSFWLALRFDRDARVMISGPAELGFTDGYFGREDDEGGCDWGWTFGLNPVGVGVATNIRCLGDPPLGACCDLTTPEATTPREFCRVTKELACHGPQARHEPGARCPNTCSITGDNCTDDADCPLACSESLDPCGRPTDPPCPSGETCNVTQQCVDLGVSFEPECGTAACCTPPEGPDGEGCTDMFEADCLAITDNAGHAAFWYPGHLCEYDYFDCMPWVCRYATGGCGVPHEAPGCNNPSCCTAICAEDAFCCEVEWDELCVDRATGQGGCIGLPVANDPCWHASPDYGAIDVAVDSSADFDNSEAQTDSSEGFSCHPHGLGTQGAGGVWFKFTATGPTARIDTCSSFGPETQDTLIEVFSVGDPTTDETACNSLQSIGCNDDGGCCRNAALSRVCVDGLIPGDTYYILVDTKTAASRGRYRLSVSSTCDAEPPTCARTLYVDPGATDRPNDGTSWCRAFRTVQDALYGARAGDEIRVAGGVYAPDVGYGRGLGDRSESFTLGDGVTLLGGFAGCGATDPDERDVKAYETVLTGDLAGDDIGDLSDPSRGENSYHVLVVEAMNQPPVIDGFTVRGGNANGYTYSTQRGGGLDCRFESVATLRNCAFVANQAVEGGGVSSVRCPMAIENCRFEANKAETGGGVATSLDTQTEFTGCIFRGNRATEDGGGLHAINFYPVLVDCLFEGNHAVGTGGGISAGGYAVVDLTNCTFVANSASGPGGGLYYEGMLSAAGDDSTASAMPNNVLVTSCIFRRNTPDQVNITDGFDVVSYSAIQGGWPGIGNSSADALFVPGPAGCYYLSQTAAGDPVNSPCLDSGDTQASTLGLDIRTTRRDEVTDAGIVDRGYHYPVTGVPLVMGDYDRDGVLTLSDVAAMQNCFTGEGPTDVTPCCRIFDFEPDGDVSLVDYETFRANLTGP